MDQKAFFKLSPDEKEILNKSFDGARRTGTTTRIADQAIQVLFNTGKVRIVNRVKSEGYEAIDFKHLVTDHHHHPQSTKHLFEIIANRVRLEHRDTTVKICSETMTLELKT